MQSQHYAAADLAALGREWISAWNSHDLDRILTLYAEDAEMTSDRIQVLGLAASGTLRGKERLRMYWEGVSAFAQFAFRSDRHLCQPRQRGRVLPERARRADLRISAARCRGQDQAGVGQSSGALNGACATPFNVDRQSNAVIACDKREAFAQGSNATKQSIFLDAARWIASLRSQ